MQLSKINRGDTIVIASYNKGKIKEFKSLLSKYGLNIITAAGLNIKDVEETGKTFKENSLIKAKNIPNNYMAISDDSGLCVNSLNGRPGIYSARFQKKCGGWFNAMEKIYHDVKKNKSADYSASFVCSLSIKFTKKIIFSYEGKIEGSLVWPPKGDNGFGYDPFFIPLGSKKTFAEIPHAKKIIIDHRSIALKKLIRSHLIDS